MKQLILALILSAAWAYFGSNSFLGNPAFIKLLSPNEGFYQNEDAAIPAPLNWPVDIQKNDTRLVIDEHGVPHIFAQNLDDAYRIQGYLHAHNRFFQMDIMTKFIGGRLSEAVGRGRLALDKTMRRRGFTWGIERIVENWRQDEDGYSYVEAYTQGVNAYVDQLAPRNYPLEYKLSDFAPSKWTPKKTAEIYMNMTYDLCFRHKDAQAAASEQKLGDEFFNLLYPLRYNDDEPIVQDKLPQNKDQVSNGSSRSTGNPHIFNNEQGEMPAKHLGSNNWAVRPEKTKDGHAILCNDPHLGLKLPMIWYEVHIHTPEQNVYGVSLPGVPGVIIGFNEDISWGVTNVSHDILDYECLEWVDEAKKIYRWEGKNVQAKVRIEKISVKNEQPVFDTLWITEAGPLTYYSQESHALKNCALHWVAFEKHQENTLSVFLDINQAKNYSEFRKAISNHVTPAQNFIFADRQGNIGLTVTGKLPIREKNNGRIADFSPTDQSNWSSYIPFEALPTMFNPKSNYVSSANQISTDTAYPYDYYGHFDHYRGRILHKKLRTAKDIDIDFMKNLQANNESLFTEDVLLLIKNFLANKTLTAEETKWKKRLLAWDGHMDHEKEEPSFIFHWFQKFHRLTWDELDKTDQVTYQDPDFHTTLHLANEQMQHPFFDNKNTKGIELADDIAYMAFKETAHYLDSLSDLNAPLTWQKYNNVTMSHLLGLKAFSIPELPVDGFRFSLNAARTGHGPSWRMIVKMSKPIEAYGIFPGGQSGHPGSQYYSNFTDRWAATKYKSLKLYDNPSDVIHDGGVEIQ